MTNDKKNHSKFLIVGAGPVGLYAAFRFGLKNIQVTVLEATENVGGQCLALYPEKFLYDIPGINKILVSDFIENLKNQFFSFTHDLIFNKKVTNISRLENGNLKIITDDGDFFETENLIIATGGGSYVPIEPQVENLESFKDHIFYKVSNKSFFQNKKIVILGGGDSAIDWALTLADVVDEMTLIHRGKEFRGSLANAEKLFNLSNVKKINVMLNSKLTNIFGSDGKLDKILVTQQIDGNHVEKEIFLDELLVFFGIKMEDNIKNFDIKLETQNGKIKIDNNTLKTSEENVYAIGDASFFENKKHNLTNGFGQASQLVEILTKK